MFFKVTKLNNIYIKGKTWIIEYNEKSIAIQIVVTKKNFKKATTRNLIKRQIVNAFLYNRSVGFVMNRINANNKYVLYKVYADKTILNSDFTLISEEVSKIFL